MERRMLIVGDRIYEVHDGAIIRVHTILKTTKHNAMSDKGVVFRTETTDGGKRARLFRETSFSLTMYFLPTPKWDDLLTKTILKEDESI